MPSPDLSQYTKTDIRPPGPSGDTGYRIYTIKGNSDDSAHYLLKPDLEFYRPWIASPGPGTSGIAFVWPLGTEGFTLSSSADLGIHKYIGDNDIDVEVTYPDEYHITLNGIFPGRHSMEQVRALRKVILHKPPSPFGKILALPLIAERVLYVQVVNHSFTHDQEDRTGTIAYSIECVQQGAGSQLKKKTLRPPKKNPTTKKNPRGKSTKRTTVKQGTSTVRATTAQVYEDTSLQNQVLASNLSRLSLELGVPAHQLAYINLPPGTALEF